MQRGLIVALLCLTVAICVTAENLELGQREDGDILAISRRIYRPAIPGKAMVAKTGHNTKGRITRVSVINADGSNAKATVIAGGVGNKHVAVAITSPVGEGLEVQFEVYVMNP